MRITIRVRPGSSRPQVGGEYAGALVVRVSAQAVDGKATEAALAAVAAAFGVRRGAVTLVSGASSRTKTVDVADGDPRVLAELLRPALCHVRPSCPAGECPIYQSPVVLDQAGQEPEVDDGAIASERRGRGLRRADGPGRAGAGTLDRTCHWGHDGLTRLSSHNFRAQILVLRD